VIVPSSEKSSRFLVAVAGGDGVGKTAVAQLLVERLNGLGHSARFVRRWDIVGNPSYPEADFLSADVRAMRSSAAGMPPNPRFLFLMWTIALAVLGDGVENSARQFVVIDGYWMKHAASEVAYGLDPEWVLSVTSGLPRSDLVLRLSLSPEEAWSRKGGDLWPYECGMDESCSRESFLTHQESIHALLDRWSDLFGWHDIEAARPVEDLVERAVKQALDISSQRA
jgi:dTMP kinase